MKRYETFFPDEWIEKIVKTKKDAGVILLHNNGKLPLHKSKVGGVGYFPKNTAYPTGISGNPLHLLAQLNFEELPPIPDFPTRGILAFYIDMHDDLYGMDLDDMQNQAGYRTYYFEDLTLPAATREELETLPQPEYPIVQGEYAIECSIGSIPLLQDNYEFKTEYNEDYYVFFEELFGDQVDDKLDEVYERFTEDMGEGIIGGYPMFTQEDPRFYREHLREHVLLFQLDSVFGEEVEVMWGDAGIANFFIHPTDLKNRRFDKAWFNWDCS
ncbi:YwqG family protein [Sporosarcina sp. FSL K6-3457]|uniref:YwqG family protein n=1 Tax=Sporosarcina sp. FSL K6-3457 TaxID=2978204 RepID=UPI0030F4E085